MSEAISHERFHTLDQQPQQPDLTLVAASRESNFELTYQAFDKEIQDIYVAYLNHNEKASGADALIKLLEQLGTIPNELEPTADAQQERQHKINRIILAKQFFEDTFIDHESSTGRNKARLIELFDETVDFDESKVIQALVRTNKQMPKDSRARALVNEAEYLYRIILADEHDIKLTFN